MRHTPPIRGMRFKDRPGIFAVIVPGPRRIDVSRTTELTEPEVRQLLADHGQTPAQIEELMQRARDAREAYVPRCSACGQEVFKDGEVCGERKWAASFLNGLGGWLICLGIILAVSPLEILGEYLGARGDQGSRSFLARVPAAVVYGDAAFVIGAVFLNVLFYQKRKIFPLCLAIYLLVTAVYSKGATAAPAIGLGWYPMKSRRVRVTFVR